MIEDILLQTPKWVFFLLIYLLFIGFKATKTQSVSLVKLCFMPLIFFVMSIHTLTSALDVSLLMVITWIISLFIGMCIGYVMVIKTNVKKDNIKNRLIIPGTWSTLILILVIFIDKYWINYQIETNKEILDNVLFDEFMIGSSALFPGIFIGKLSFYFRILKFPK